jgi:DNA polymerase I
MRNWFDADFKANCLADPKTDLDFLKDVVNIEQVRKYDALHDSNVTLNKVSFTTPDKVKQTHKAEGFWENHIRFYQNYIYENDIQMGMPYEFENGHLTIQKIPEIDSRVSKILELFPEESRDQIKRFVQMFEYPVPDFKRVALDAEILNKDHKTIPNPDSANLPVVCITFLGSDGRRIAYLLNQGKDFVKMPNVDELVIFNDEKELLEATFKLMLEYPFIITFNGDEFDLPYFKNRAIRLGIPEETIPIKKVKDACIVKHATHIDLYKFFNIKAIRIYAFKGKYKRVTLDAVGKALLKKGKSLEPWEKDMREMSYEQMTNYCMTDTEITYNLTAFDNNLVMNLILALTRMSQMPIDVVCRKSVSLWIKSILYYEHKKNGYLIPTQEEIREIKGETASKAIIKGKKYKGAIVFPPKGGSHWNAKVGDFASLYPSILKVYNIGYATINCPHEECKHNKVGELPHWICTKHKALESILIGGIRDMRVMYYKKKAKDKTIGKDLQNWYSVVEQSIKVIMNASYGVLGSESFVLYCPPSAEEVTGIARHIISHTAQHAEEIGLEVLYGDTDSIFIKNPPEDKLAELVKWTEEKYHIDFEIEKTYRYVCLSERKKNYLGVKEDGDVDVKGMTGKKRHTPKIFKDAFTKTKTVLAGVQNPEELQQAKEEIKQLVKTVYATLKNRKWKDMEDLAFNMGLNREIEKYTKTTPQHVRVARLMIEAGYTVEVGAIISFVKTTTKDGVKPTNLTKKNEVNVSKYIEFLRSTFEQVLDPLEIEFDELVGVVKLEQWF